MPTYVITAPDGKEYEVSAPEGASEAEVLEYAKTNYQKAETPKKDGLARGVGLAARAAVTGASAPVNIVADGLAGAGNIVASLFGSDKRFPYLSEIQQKGMSNLGVPKPETLPEKMLSGGVSALAGAGAVNAVAAPVRAAAPMVTQGPAGVTSTAVGGAVAPGVEDSVKNITGSDLAGGAAAFGASAILGALAGKGAEQIAGMRQRGQLLSTEQIRQRARANYDALDNSGVGLEPVWVDRAIQRAEGALRQERYDPHLHPEVARTLNVMREVLEPNVQWNQPVPFGRLDELRKRAGDLRASSDRNTQRLGGILVDEIDNIIGNVPQMAVRVGSQADAQEAARAVSAARRDWRNLSRAETIEELMRKADITSDRPTAAHSEQFRQQLIALQKNDRKLRQFTEQEREAIRAITRDGPVGKAASWVASFNPQRGGLRASGMTIGAVGGAATGTPSITAAMGTLMAAGWTTDKVLELTKNAAGRRLIQDLANGTARAPTPYEYARGAFGASVATQEDTQ